MTRTNNTNGWGGFTNVVQDTPGKIVSGGGGLSTSNLSNCLCLVLTDGYAKYEMIHANPEQENLGAWIVDMRRLTNATEAMITGANDKVQKQARLDILAKALRDLPVVDETHTAWAVQHLGATPGSRPRHVGEVAVNAAMDEYFLGTGWPALNVAAHGGGKKSKGCVIL